MIIYLRSKDNTNLFEVEIYQTNKVIEVQASIYSNHCFHYILNHSKSQKHIELFIEEFKTLEELRGWYFEIYRQSKEPQDIASVITKIRSMLKEVAGELDLVIVED